jgi:hypothetical protein
VPILFQNLFVENKKGKEEEEENFNINKKENSAEISPAEFTRGVISGFHLARDQAKKISKENQMGEYSIILEGKILQILLTECKEEFLKLKKKRNKKKKKFFFFFPQVEPGCQKCHLLSRDT